MTPRPSNSASPKSKAYRTSGLKTKDPHNIRLILQGLLAAEANPDLLPPDISIRVVAKSACEQDNYTAIFVSGRLFEDKVARCDFRRSYPYPCDEAIDTSMVLDESGPSYITVDSHFKGPTILSDPIGKPTTDVIVLPGLGGGHAYGSFKDPNSDYMWLVDSLRHDFDMFRIVTYGFDSRVPDSNNVQDLEAIATESRASLRSIRTEPITPIVYLAQSLGGLAVKQAVVDMAKSDNSVDQANFRAIYGLFFFGVPNDGMNIKALKPMVREQPNEEFIMSLADNSQLLRNLRKEFSDTLSPEAFKSIQIILFYETQKSKSPTQFSTGAWSNTGKEMLVVSQSSATYGLPMDYEAHHIQALNLDHRSLVRFPPNSSDYHIVKSYLDPCTSNACNAVGRRLERMRHDELKKQRVALNTKDSR